MLEEDIPGHALTNFPNQRPFLHFMMRFIFIHLLLLSSICNYLHAQSEIIGTWLTEDQTAKVRIFENDNRYFGKIIWLKESGTDGKDLLDENNPDQPLRNRPLIGVEILTNFRYDGNQKWSGGEIYEPRHGHVSSGKLKLSSTNQLEVRGYIGLPIFGSTEVWTRE